MIKEDVKHLFDRSACLTKKQFEAYLSGNMITEEVYAIEHHINGCPLCSMAMDGMQLRKDALIVANQLNTGFLEEHLAATPQQASSNAAAYVKSLKPKEFSTKPLMTGVKVLVAIGACAGILWFVQSVGKNNTSTTKKEEPQEAVAGVDEETKPDEQSVMVEEPLTIDQQPVEETTLEQTEPAKQEPVIGPPEDKPIVTNPQKPATVPPTTAKPATTPTTTKPVATDKKEVLPTKSVPKLPVPKTEKPPATKPAPPVVKQEEPKVEPPKPVVKEEPKPQPAVEQPEPKPAPAKEPEEALPADAIAAGKVMMSKSNYNAAINKMRNEMRSTDKSRRQEAVMLVAKCYQQLGNKQRATELLKSIIDEGGPEKKNAKKRLKEIDKNAKVDD